MSLANFPSHSGLRMSARAHDYSPKISPTSVYALIDMHYMKYASIILKVLHSSTAKERMESMLYRLLFKLTDIKYEAVTKVLKTNKLTTSNCIYIFMWQCLN